jgi:hypothetical protein
MIKRRLLLGGISVAVCLLLWGCGSTPIERGGTVTLEPGEGVAAVVMDTLDNVTQISMQGTDKDGTQLKIPSVPAGVHMYVFAAPAGTYCLANFWYGRYLIYMKDHKHGVCFDVIAGKTAYSGNISPRATATGGIITEQIYHWAWFESALEQEHPGLAKIYPVVTP